LIDKNWEILDSLNEKYLPVQNEKKETINKKLSEINELPPLVNAGKLGADRKFFPNAGISDPNSDSEAHAIPVETYDQGRFYIMVILKTDKREALRRAAQPLIYTLGVLLISTLITVLLVWRFTKPIAELSNAAKRVAEGDLGVRVTGGQRSDELGQLSERFNEMTAGLEVTRELESKLQQAEKSAVVGRLASAIAHEIRNPLNYINLTLDQLRAKFVPEDQKKAEVFEKLTLQLKLEVARINQQVSDFLRYSKPLKLELRPILIKDVIEDSLNIVRHQAEEQDVTIAVSQEPDKVTVKADSEVLRSVFNNLFLNAVQAMPGGGELRIAISTEAELAVIEIADTGSGIPEENLSKIFEPYFSTKETGTGLGLAIVKRTVDEHRGTITVESTAGSSTKFTVKLPLE
jgi:signal transduction histidine kinase